MGRPQGDSMYNPPQEEGGGGGVVGTPYNDLFGAGSLSVFGYITK